MSMFDGPIAHTANPPETWSVVKTGARWSVVARGGKVLESHARKRDAEEARTEGRLIRLYDKETRWYAGESVDGWKPYPGATRTPATEVEA